MVLLLAWAGPLAAQRIPRTPSAPRRKPPPVAAPVPDLAAPCPLSDSTCVPPVLPREFRGVWVATVRNIDWPSKPGLPPALQRAELTAILDRAVAVGLNAVILQVRPSGDALYASPIEPWSVYLTGRQGLPPAPRWDPLAFAVREAHARGLELHAWFNPYRAKDASAKGPLSRTHFARRHPALVKSYGKQLWMDPGEPAVRARTVRVVLDVVRRYDIDGVHIDDYFYPYPERRANGSTEFPDDRSWKRYRKTGGTLTRDDWRRHNVDQLVETLYHEITRVKPWVKFGISPFGIWRPGYPDSVSGLDAYAALYADSRKWLNEGWLDYITPQLYWPLNSPHQSYGALLRWWVEENTRQRHVWPGNYTGRVGDAGSAPWLRGEILEQIVATREQPGATGNVHFSMEAFIADRDSVGTVLGQGLYALKALVPASPWKLRALMPVPTVHLRRAANAGEALVIAAAGKEPARWWVVQAKTDSVWIASVFDGAQTRIMLETLLKTVPMRPDVIAVTAVDRAGNASDPAVLRLP